MSCSAFTPTYTPSHVHHAAVIILQRLPHSPLNHLVNISLLSFAPSPYIAPSHPSLFFSMSSHLSAVQEAASVASGHLAQSPINETARCFSLFDSPLLSVCTLKPAEHTISNQKSTSKEQPEGKEQATKDKNRQREEEEL